MSHPTSLCVRDTRRTTFPAPLIVAVALRVKEFMGNRPRGSVVINADDLTPINPTSAKQKEEANRIYEAIGSDGEIAYTKAESSWLVRFRSALHLSNEGVS